MSFAFARRAMLFAVTAFAITGSGWAQSGSPPRLTWTLDDVIGTAIAQHPLVEAASARLDAAQGVRRTAGTLPNPIATYWVEHGTASGPMLPLGQTLANDSVREMQTYFTLPLEPLFQRGPRVRHADEEIKVAEANIKTARRQVALDSANVFFRVALAQVSVEAAQQNRAGLEQLVSYNQVRVTHGTTAEVDLIRAQVELDRASTNVALAEVDLVRSRAELWAFLGFPGPAPNAFAVILPAAGTGAVLSALADYVAQARERRPEIVSARARVAAAAADVEYQRRLSVRQLGATFGFKRTAGINSLLGGISVPIPLFDQNRGEVQRATGESLAAQKELAWAERTVGAEVQGAYDSAQRLSAQVGTLRNSFVDRASEADRITIAAYQEGAATLLQVLDTARALSETRLAYYRLLLAQRQSVLDLALAVGNEPSVLGAQPTSGGLTSVTQRDSGDQR